MVKIKIMSVLLGGFLVLGDKRRERQGITFLKIAIVFRNINRSRDQT